MISGPLKGDGKIDYILKPIYKNKASLKIALSITLEWYGKNFDNRLLNFKNKNIFS